MAEQAVDNPYDATVAATVETLSTAELAEAAERAAQAGRELAGTNIRERMDLCDRFVAAIEQAAESIALDVTRQMGKPISQSRAEVATMVSRARHMVAIAERELSVERLAAAGGLDRWIERVPVGVVLDIAAWNYPLLIPVNVVVPAVLAGNAVVLKHSRRTPLCAFHFSDGCAAAGAPARLVTGVVADHASTAELIAHTAIGYVAFTGSVEGGRAVSQAAAGRFIDVGLELGGKDPAYVRADADLAAAAEGIAEGAFYNAGQSCCGVERVYVAAAVYDDFVDALAAAAAAWQPGDPLDPDTRLGPMARPSAVGIITAQVADAFAHGARVVTGGNSTTHHGKGRYFAATVLADATHAMSVMTEETFGPVAAVASVSDDGEAIALMNSSRYGLTASLWTRDVEIARRLGTSIEAGTVFLNRCDYLDPALPWSGWKDSGVGITLSRLGFGRLVRTRAFNYRLP